MIQIQCVQHWFGLTLNVTLSQLIPGALQIAFEEDREFRQGLPLNYLDFMGVANSELVRCYPCTQNQHYPYPRKLLYSHLLVSPYFHKHPYNLLLLFCQHQFCTETYYQVLTCVQECRLMRCMLFMISITKCPLSYKVTKTHTILSNLK